jgi:hypothetical protein
LAFLESHEPELNGGAVAIDSSPTRLIAAREVLER